MHNLKICHINARSIYVSRCHNKLDELAVVASVHSFDILYVTESWLRSNVDNSCIHCLAIPNLSVLTETPMVVV